MLSGKSQILLNWIGWMLQIVKDKRYKVFRSKPAYHLNRNFDRIFFFFCVFCTSAEITFSTFFKGKPVAQMQ